MNRTNGFHTAGRALKVPWPRRYGTPPWGAEKELENLLPGVRAAYRIHVVRFGSAAARREAYQDLVGLVRRGRPALLYVGSSRLPRHVTLVLPREADAQLDVYDPATGSVTGLFPERFASCTLGIAGWDVPWLTVQPRSR